MPAGLRWRFRDKPVPVRTDVFGEDRRSRWAWPSLPRRRAAMLSLAGGLAMIWPALAAGQSPAASGNGRASTGGAAASQASSAKSGTGGPAATGQGADAAKPKGPLAHFDIDDFAVQGETLLSQLELEQAIYPFLGPN